MMMEERISNGDHTPGISDMHIEKLEIAEDSVLLLRVPINLSQAEGVRTLNLIRNLVHEKTGFKPGILMVARDSDLASLNIEALNKLKAEIDATLQYHYSKLGGDGGN